MKPLPYVVTSRTDENGNTYRVVRDNLDSFAVEFLHGKDAMGTARWTHLKHLVRHAVSVNVELPGALVLRLVEELDDARNAHCPTYDDHVHRLQEPDR